jgi:hypothetical protein
MAHEHVHDAPERANKNIAILISVLALLLSLAETLGKSAQTDGLKHNVETANLWAFFQAKTIRKTTLETAAEQMEVDAELAKDTAVKDVLDKRIAGWRLRAARYESEPETGEGRKELMARAKSVEAKTELAIARYHNYEYGSAAFQIAIVLASAYLVTEIAFLLWGALALGSIGGLLIMTGFFAPHLVF